MKGWEQTQAICPLLLRIDTTVTPMMANTSKIAKNRVILLVIACLRITIKPSFALFILASKFLFYSYTLSSCSICLSSSIFMKLEISIAFVTPLSAPLSA